MGFLGRIGIWSRTWSMAIRSGDPGPVRAATDLAVELEELGYGAIWLGQSPAVGYAAPLLEATERITVATGITRIWDTDAGTVAGQYAELEERHPGRFLLGLGVSHGEIAEDYARPYRAMRRYLDGLDAAPVPVPVERRILAALGPKMLALSRDRAAGAHPYLVTVEQIAEARAILGPGPVLAPEYKVVLDPDLARARDAARDYLAGYLRMRNYTASFERAGFTAEDFQGGGSARLIDAVFALGGPDAVRARIAAILAAGADHVAVQVVTSRPGATPEGDWRALARLLPLGG